MKARLWLLIVAYALLVFIVAFGAFFINDQFDDQHETQCMLAVVQARLATANLALVADPQDHADVVPVLNSAIRQLNDTCGTDIHEVKENP